MAISKELFLAILTQDSYNRGYASGLFGSNQIGDINDGLGSVKGTQIGSATISHVLQGIPAYFDTAFQVEAQSQGLSVVK